MENVVEKLIADFETGRIGRRQFAQTLLAAAAAGAIAAPGAAFAAAAPAATGYKTKLIDHLSYGDPDYRPVRDFYTSILGWEVAEQDDKQCRLIFGPNKTEFIIRNRANLPNGPFIDHIAYLIDGKDPAALEAELKKRGFTPRADHDPVHGSSFHVKDPAGLDVQIVIKA